MKLNNKTKCLLGGLLAAGVLMISASSCSDDKDVRVPLSSPTEAGSSVTPTTYTFDWNGVEGATQYAYELRDAAGEKVTAGVKQVPSVYLTGLTPASDYELDVWAFAPALSEEYSTSEVTTIKFKTPAQTPLAQPAPAASENGQKIYLSWDDVENAQAYDVAYTTPDGESGYMQVTRNYVCLPAAVGGDYVIKVNTSAAGSDWYKDSEPFTITYTKADVARNRRYVGTFTMPAWPDSSWSATLEVYADGVYSIKAWYLVDGYDVDFKVDDNGEVYFVNCPYTGGYWYIPFDAENTGYVYEPVATIKRTSGTISFKEYYSGEFVFSW